jgi:hypothetical protein
MSRDALFQLGMGSVPLKTSQEEDTLRTLVSGIRAGKPLRMLRLAAEAAMAISGRVVVAVRRGGNSAKALISPAAISGNH